MQKNLHVQPPFGRDVQPPCLSNHFFQNSHFIPIKPLSLKPLVSTDIEIDNSEFTLSLPESILETCNAVLTFESVNEILWCDHAFK